MTKEENGWDEHKLLVLAALKRIEEQQNGLMGQFQELRNNFTELQTEARTAKYFGGIVLPAAVALGFSWVGRKLGF